MKCTKLYFMNFMLNFPIACKLIIKLFKYSKFNQDGSSFRIPGQLVTYKKQYGVGVNHNPGFSAIGIDGSSQ